MCVCDRLLVDLYKACIEAVQKVIVCVCVIGYLLTCTERALRLYKKSLCVCVCVCVCV